MLRSWPSVFGLDVLHLLHNVKNIQAMVINVGVLIAREKNCLDSSLDVSISYH